MKRRQSVTNPISLALILMLTLAESKGSPSCLMGSDLQATTTKIIKQEPIIVIPVFDGFSERANSTEDDSNDGDNESEPLQNILDAAKSCNFDTNEKAEKHLKEKERDDSTSIKDKEKIKGKDAEVAKKIMSTAAKNSKTSAGTKSTMPGAKITNAKDMDKVSSMSLTRAGLSMKLTATATALKPSASTIKKQIYSPTSAANRMLSQTRSLPYSSVSKKCTPTTTVTLYNKLPSGIIPSCGVSVVDCAPTTTMTITNPLPIGITAPCGVSIVTKLPKVSKICTPTTTITVPYALPSEIKPTCDVSVVVAKRCNPTTTMTILNPLPSGVSVPCDIKVVVTKVATNAYPLATAAASKSGSKGNKETIKTGPSKTNSFGLSGGTSYDEEFEIDYDIYYPRSKEISENKTGPGSGAGKIDSKGSASSNSMADKSGSKSASSSSIGKSDPKAASARKSSSTAPIKSNVVASAGKVGTTASAAKANSATASIKPNASASAGKVGTTSSAKAAAPAAKASTTAKFASVKPGVATSAVKAGTGAQTTGKVASSKVNATASIKSNASANKVGTVFSSVKATAAVASSAKSSVISSMKSNAAPVSATKSDVSALSSIKGSGTIAAVAKSSMSVVTPSLPKLSTTFSAYPIQTLVKPVTVTLRPKYNSDGLLDVGAQATATEILAFANFRTRTVTRKDPYPVTVTATQINAYELLRTKITTVSKVFKEIKTNLVTNFHTVSYPVSVVSVSRVSVTVPTTVLTSKTVVTTQTLREAYPVTVTKIPPPVTVVSVTPFVQTQFQPVTVTMKPVDIFVSTTLIRIT